MSLSICNGSQRDLKTPYLIMKSSEPVLADPHNSTLHPLELGVLVKCISNFFKHSPEGV